MSAVMRDPGRRMGRDDLMVGEEEALVGTV